MKSYIEPSLTILIALVLLTLALTQPIKVLKIGYITLGILYIIKGLYQINEISKLRSSNP